MKLEWKPKYISPFEQNINKILKFDNPIELKEEAPEDIIQNLQASMFSEIAKQQAEIVDIKFTQALSFLTKRQKKKVKKWVIKALENNEKKLKCSR